MYLMWKNSQRSMGRTMLSELRYNQMYGVIRIVQPPGSVKYKEKRYRVNRPLHISLP